MSLKIGDRVKARCDCHHGMIGTVTEIGPKPAPTNYYATQMAIVQFDEPPFEGCRPDNKLTTVVYELEILP